MIRQSNLFYLGVFIWVLSMAVPENASGSEWVNLYSVSAPVESRSAAERKRAAKNSITQVFIRASGDRQVMRNYPLLKRHLRSASQYLASYQYAVEQLSVDQRAPGGPNLAYLDETADGSPTEQPEAQREQLILQLTFEERKIRRALEAAGAPYWPETRPLVLIWIMEQTNGQDEFVQADERPEVFEQLGRLAEARGVPIALPLLDLEEILTMPADALWSAGEQAIIDHAGRYNADYVLLGKLAETYRGVMGQWKVLPAKDVRLGLIEAETVESFLATGIHQLADQLAARFAVGGSQQVSGHSYRMLVSGVKSQRDYFQLSEYLNGIDVIEDLQMTTVNGSTITFQFNFSGNRSQLQSLLTLDDRLQHNAYRDELSFVWRVR